MLLGTLLVASLLAAPGGMNPRQDLSSAITAMRAVGPDGQGAGEAAKAWLTLCQADVAQVPDLLAAMNGANPLAKNWLRAAVDAVKDKGRAQGKPLPTATLEAFLKDKRQDPQARRFAYDLLLENDATVPDRYLPTMLDDPSPDLRRDAVARVFDEAEKLFKDGKKDEAKERYRTCFQAARDQSQIIRSARRLGELGEKPDLANHLGMVMDWQIIGPFPNPDQKGMETAYPPEKEYSATAEYDGKEGKVRWQPYVSKHELGMINLKEALNQSADVTAYTRTEFTADKEQDVEIRLGCVTAFKLWVNGELTLERGDAYTGTRLDHYVAKARLKAGKNTILVKSCLDTPPPQLPKVWQFQLRVCDANGVAILSTTRPKVEVTEPKKP
jgi:hypothetical protein